ncbi:uncharacterized protein [Musca autumnalis]|uniref:uncharacterized protein n=1 Tax=Musca autumnalis TaxID=221902 RepID=UPI003CFB0223
MQRANPTKTYKFGYKADTQSTWLYDRALATQRTSPSSMLDPFAPPDTLNSSTSITEAKETIRKRLSQSDKNKNINKLNRNVRQNTKHIYTTTHVGLFDKNNEDKTMQVVKWLATGEQVTVPYYPDYEEYNSKFWFSPHFRPREGFRFEIDSAEAEPSDAAAALQTSKRQTKLISLDIPADPNSGTSITESEETKENSTSGVSQNDTTSTNIVKPELTATEAVNPCSTDAFGQGAITKNITFKQEPLSKNRVMQTILNSDKNSSTTDDLETPLTESVTSTNSLTVSMGDNAGNSNGEEDSKEAAKNSILHIPHFCAKNPEKWFAQVESEFARTSIISESTKCRTVLIAIQNSTVPQIVDAIEGSSTPNSYVTLKKRILLQCSKQNLIIKTFQYLELGDRKPSELLTKMRQLGGEVINDNILKPIWMNCLPSNVQGIISISNDDLNTLAVLADKLLLAITDTNEYVNCVSVPPLESSPMHDGSLEFQLSLLCKEIADLKLKIAERDDKMEMCIRLLNLVIRD